MEKGNRDQGKGNHPHWRVVKEHLPQIIEAWRLNNGSPRKWNGAGQYARRLTSFLLAIANEGSSFVSRFCHLARAYALGSGKPGVWGRAVKHDDALGLNAEAGHHVACGREEVS